uniref:BED-type domain-containing protein n=2 Tax=Bactrocera latifrons TaxID=174628 RepID=A0A0K8VE47_BACLA
MLKEGSNKLDGQTVEYDDIPVIVNGKYFKIIEEMNATEHQRVTRGIVAVCQHCPREKVRSIQGSMRITSNFVRHLKTLHPEKYEEFIIERQNHSRTPRGRRTQKRKASQIGEVQNENNSRTEKYMNEYDNKEHSSDGASIYIDDMQPTSANNSNNVDNPDLYSAESNDTHISEESLDKRQTASTCQLTCDPNEIPTILNGKYFKIVEQDTSSNRISISVVAACQFCDNDKFVKGPLRVTSNFVQHLRSCHFKEYNMYLQEKFNSSTRCRRLLNRQQTQLPFVEKVLNFILLSNIPVSVLEEPSFVELFRGTGLTMCSCAQLLARLDDMHGGFVEDTKRNLEEIPYICSAVDIWTSRKTHYFGYSIFWLDNELKRQMAVLACVKLSDSPTHKEIEAVITQIQNKYDLNDEKIICNVIDNVHDFVQTYHNFSIKSICPDDHNDDLNISHSNAQVLLNQLPKQFKYGERSLHLLTVFDFDRILKSHDRLQHALTR